MSTGLTMSIKFSFLLPVIFLCLAVIGHAEPMQVMDVLKIDGDIIRTVLQAEVDKIEEMPITLFPEKTESDLVLLRKGFKKYYFVKSVITRIKFDYEKKKENLEQGRYKSAKVFLNPCLIKSFPVDEAYFYLRNVVMDREGKTFTYESIKFFFIIDLKQVSEYVYKECIKHGIQWPEFSLRGKEILLKGNLKIVGLDLKVRAIGTFELSELKEIYFKVSNAKFSFVPVPAFVIGQIMKRLNPMIALGKLPYGLYPCAIECFGENKIGLVFKN